VDHVARICIWRTSKHYALTHQELRLALGLQQRIETWIDRHIELHDRLQDDLETYNGWLDYDQEGREIARQIKPALGPGAKVYYFSRATEEYERIV
jgi:hypothetical protein